MSRQRKPRAAVRRLSRGIEPRECTLIVCEGRKTEPKYMGKLRQRLRLSSAQVHVVPQGAAPIAVVDRALEKRHERSQDCRLELAPCEYDKIWCVFDVEEPGKNASLPAALNKASDNGLCVALSNPAFEYWLLLHFEKTGTMFRNCAAVVRQLKKHLPKYGKGKDVADDTIDRLDTAVRNARSIDRQQWRGQRDRTKCNPSTDVYKLVEYLQDMAKRRPYP